MTRPIALHRLAIVLALAALPALAVVRVARKDFIDPEIRTTTVVHINGIRWIPEPPVPVPVMHRVADYNHDCRVDLADLTAWIAMLEAAWRNAPVLFRYHYLGDDLRRLGDLDGDSEVDLADYAILQREAGRGRCDG